jgi:hypothetical protein
MGWLVSHNVFDSDEDSDDDGTGDEGEEDGVLMLLNPADRATVVKLRQKTRVAAVDEIWFRKLIASTLLSPTSASASAKGQSNDAAATRGFHSARAAIPTHSSSSHSNSSQGGQLQSNLFSQLQSQSQPRQLSPNKSKPQLQPQGGIKDPKGMKGQSREREQSPLFRAGNSSSNAAATTDVSASTSASTSVSVSGLSKPVHARDATVAKRVLLPTQDNSTVKVMPNTDIKEKATATAEALLPISAATVAVAITAAAESTNAVPSPTVALPLATALALSTLAAASASASASTSAPLGNAQIPPFSISKEALPMPNAPRSRSSTLTESIEASLATTGGGRTAIEQAIEKAVTGNQASGLIAVGAGAGAGGGRSRSSSILRNEEQTAPTSAALIAAEPTSLSPRASQLALRNSSSLVAPSRSTMSQAPSRVASRSPSISELQPQ